jgi:hypothetical protein
MYSGFDVVLTPLLATLSQLFWLFLPLAGQLALLTLLSRFFQVRLARTFGWTGVKGVCWLGTMAHELGHALGTWLTGGKVHEIHLWEPDRETGQLGYVVASHRFFLGRMVCAIAPFFSVTAAMLLVARLAFPQFFVAGLQPPLLDQADVAGWPAFGHYLATTGQYYGQVLLLLFTAEALRQPTTYLFVYLMLSLASGISPSPPDFKLFLPAALIGLGVLLLVNLGAALAGPEASAALHAALARGVANLSAFLAYGVLFTLLAAGLLLPFWRRG